jgi:hypothetical protein
LKRAAFLPLALLAGAACLVPAVDACAPVYRDGAAVRIARESALIVWDEASKTEHFIRRATFDTRTPDFGFLVPTPTVPTLVEAPDRLFTTLAGWTKPKEVVRVVPGPPPGPPPNAAERPLAPRVEVLHAQQVAGMDAVVLRASDPAALAGWLKKHGYAARPALTDWLERYVRQGWVVTAFKFARTDAGAMRLEPKAVRLTFQTDRPFYPYREPADVRGPGLRGERLLRVFVLATGRTEGALGDSGTWPGRAVWAGPVSAAQRDKLYAGLKLPAGTGEAPWLTEFEDDSFPRPGTDEVFFGPAREQVKLERPPVVRYEYSNGAPAPSAPGFTPRTSSEEEPVWPWVLVGGVSVAGLALLPVLLWLLLRRGP